MLKIGLIGAGAVAKSHLMALREIEGVQVTALCDPVKERAEALAGPFGALAFAEYEPVLERSDAVWVCTPPSTRREQAVAVAQARRPMVMDKPIATTEADAFAIVEAVDRAGILAITNFSQRFGWLGRRMKTLVDSGALGDVISVWSHSILPDPSHESWRHDPRFACGFTIESLSHNIDQIRWLAGPITAVAGRVARTLPELPAFDNTMAALLTLQSGGSGVLHASWVSTLSSGQTGIIGTRGTVLSSGRGLRFRTVDMPEEQLLEPDDSLPAMEPSAPHPHRGSLSWDFRVADRCYVDCIRERRPPPATVRDGQAALQVSLAILRSSDQGQILPVDPIPVGA
jgi:myo-inositol 2-dehydrogenase / D-chiro-inositol 1-dehydrogenase